MCWGNIGTCLSNCICWGGHCWQLSGASDEPQYGHLCHVACDGTSVSTGYREGWKQWHVVLRRQAETSVGWGWIWVTSTAWPSFNDWSIKRAYLCFCPSPVSSPPQVSTKNHKDRQWGSEPASSSQICPLPLPLAKILEEAQETRHIWPYHLCFHTSQDGVFALNCSWWDFFFPHSRYLVTFGNSLSSCHLQDLLAISSTI